MDYSEFENNVKQGKFQFPFNFKLPINLIPSWMMGLGSSVFMLAYYVRAQFIPNRDEDWISL